MPNCDFYATVEDHRAILNLLFKKATCRVYESYSDYESPLKRFETPDEVLREFNRCYPNGKKWSAVYLQLYVIGAGPKFKPQRVALDPVACNGATFRYSADGWGLIQLYLASATADGLDSSHTNHHSETGATACFPTCPELGDPSLWDFEQIAAFSSRLNRGIRKMGVAEIGSRAILPGALKVWESGLPLQPYLPKQHTVTAGKATG